MKKKIYCYVDENGQDTNGRLFIVAAILVDTDKEAVLSLLEKIENTSGKKKFKWGKAEKSRRLNYLKYIFSLKKFGKKLFFCINKKRKSYDVITIQSIAKIIHYKKTQEIITVNIYIDGLSKTKRHLYGSELRKLGVRTGTIQGVRKDENNSLTRLADAIAGFVRDILDKEKGEAKVVFDKAIKESSLIEV